MAAPEVINELAHTVSDAEWHATRAAIEVTAVTAGALMGSLHGIKRDFDLVGVTVVGLVSGLGGGILRDVLIAQGPVLALQRPSLLLASFLACAVGMVLGHRTHHLRDITWFVESVALGLFTVSGIQRAEEVGLSLMPALFLGVVTGTCGGLLRDVICSEVPMLVLPGRPLAFAALFCGVTYYTALRVLTFPTVVCEWLSVLAGFGLRALAAWRKWEIRRPHEVFRLPPTLRKRWRGLARKDRPD